MEWKNKIDECCAAELADMTIHNIKAGFLSFDEILEGCKEYIEENYPEDGEAISDDEFRVIIKDLCSEFQNSGNQENYLKLDGAFNNLIKQGIVALHYAGYTQSDGFEDCNEIATERYNKGEKVIGCCFYTMQDLGHILDEESKLLRISFGNYFDNPSAEEIGQLIVRSLETSGFRVRWDRTSNTKIAIEDFKWDKYYLANE